MDSRKIQKSGTTHYVYLPANWCRENEITTDSVVTLEKNSKGDLILHPKEVKKEMSILKIDLSHQSEEAVNKLIIASYINPVKSFEINLESPLSSQQVLTHKKLLGGMELFDFEDNKISCQTSFSLKDPDMLLKNMIRKVKGIIMLIKKQDVPELIERYEEEIDKSNLLIHKAVISSFMFKRASRLRHIDLFYLSLISRMIEQITDYLLCLDSEDGILDDFYSAIEKIESLIEYLNQDDVMNLIEQITDLKDAKGGKNESFIYKRIINLLDHITEILSDWLITNKVDD
ncbi:MAG: hypothetical protein KKF44_00670 [Nanoarchaeota archaeon]|nr:hypothetical protein [Nanoarchaeota archaeon]